TRRVVHYQDAGGAGVARVADLGREGADAAVDDDDLPCVRPSRDRRASLGRRTRGRGGGGAVPVRELRGYRRVEGTEVADGRAERGRGDDYRDPEEVIVRRGAGRDRVGGLSGTLDRVHTGPRVAGCDRHDHSRIRGAVAGDGELVLEAVDATAEAHVDHVHAVLDGVLDRLRDVVRGRVRGLPGEHIVVAEERLGRDAREADHGRELAVRWSGRAVHARDGSGDVRAVVLERLRRERPRLPGEVDARDDHLLAGELLVARIELG